MKTLWNQLVTLVIDLGKYIILLLIIVVVVGAFMFIKDKIKEEYKKLNK